jgi:hypothetical protein
MLEEPELFACVLLDWLDTLPAPTAAGYRSKIQ